MPVAKINLSRMDVQARKQVEDTLVSQRATLEKQLAALGGSIASIGGKAGRGGGRGSALKGKKVAPKYRGPDGDTWAGRGATPMWLKAATKGTGKKIDDFLIEKTSVKGKKTRKKNG
jgi:DNA-binding protein H-NS